MGYIYKITNTVNNKVYIGQTKQDPDKRWSGHKGAIKSGKGCPCLQKAFNKYGEDKFKFEVLIICFDEARFELEKYYIKKFNAFGENGYNSNEGGEQGGNFKGKHHKPELIERLRQLNIERYKNPENRKMLADKVKEGMTKINLSEKIRAAMTKKREAGIPLFKNRVCTRTGNYILSEETKEKIRNSINKLYANNTINKENLRRKISQSAIKRIGRPINQYTLDGMYISSYCYIKEAGDKTGIGRVAIQAHLLGYSKSSGGFIWKYADKYHELRTTISSFFN